MPGREFVGQNVVVLRRRDIYLPGKNSLRGEDVVGNEANVGNVSVLGVCTVNGEPRHTFRRILQSTFSAAFYQTVGVRRYIRVRKLAAHARNKVRVKRRQSQEGNWRCPFFALRFYPAYWITAVATSVYFCLTKKSRHLFVLYLFFLLSRRTKIFSK